MAHVEPGAAAPHGHHITPKSTLIKVFLALVGLTILTVVTAQIHLGPLNVPLALAIAATKAALVVMFFMALKYDSPVNTLVFSVGSIFVLVFLAFTLFDTAFRDDLGAVGNDTVWSTPPAGAAAGGGAAAPAAGADSIAVSDTTGADSSAADTAGVQAERADTTAPAGGQ